MNKYIIYCTPEQIKKALELDAPVEVYNHFDSDDIKEANIFYKDKFIELSDGKLAERTTTEQMIGWLIDEKKIFVKVNPYISLTHKDEYDSLLVNLVNGNVLLVKQACNSPKEAILEAIDVALEFLKKNKNEST